MTKMSIDKLTKALGKSCRKRILEMMKTITKDPKLLKELTKTAPIKIH
jgi:hypothetical protein